MTQPNDQLAQGFAKYLSRHGFGFQYAVIKYVKDLIESLQIAMNDDFWRFLLSGFPDEGSGWETTCCGNGWALCQKELVIFQVWHDA